ncbi:hypothetical protein B0H16DRAFT_1733408 [Mycena metata]|uniref:Uncharacterized protein n=1 Tax=Mycena metata TaxID=1033252 RepID=A0AAD7I063_9AGAR|nr:hypothetical protein B0H16DRAFT_1733408 [Mycena metata]
MNTFLLYLSAQRGVSQDELTGLANTANDDDMVIFLDDADLSVSSFLRLPVPLPLPSATPQHHYLLIDQPERGEHLIERTMMLLRRN